MRRFWLDSASWQNETLQIEGDLFHHIRDVCRFAVGDRFELLAPPGEAFFVEVTGVEKRSLTVRRLETRVIPELPRPHIHLAISVPRFQKLDWIVEKCVELGVTQIHPFVSEYSFVRAKTDLPAGKMDRWQKLIRQATQQSGRGDLMSMAPAATLTELLASFNRQPKVLGLFPYEGECPRTLREALAALPARDFNEIWLFVGSEGGFSRAEVEQFQAHGLEPLSLGEQILRVETACLALVSIIKYEFEPLR